MRIYLILLAGVFPLTVSACINAEGFSIFGKKTFYDLPLTFIKKMDVDKYRADAVKRVNQLITEYKNKPPTVYYYNELGVARIYEGKLKEAKRLLLEGFKLDSMDYRLNSNLAVVMEAERNIDSAMLLMKKVIGINKYSHFGSEWIHLNILHAIKKIENDKNWIYTHNIFGLVRSNDSLPATKDQMTVRNAVDLEIQLKERMIFVKPVDVIVGNMLLTLADLYTTHADFRYADEAYLLAKEYDPKLAGVVDKRRAYIKLHGDEILAKFKENDTILQKEKQSANEKHPRSLSGENEQKQNTLQATGQSGVSADSVSKKKHKKMPNYIFFGGLGLILIIAASLYRRRRR